MPKMKSLGGLCIDLLKDMYYGEKQIAEAVKMTKQAASAEPRCAFEHPRKETE